MDDPSIVREVFVDREMDLAGELGLDDGLDHTAKLLPWILHNARCGSDAARPSARNGVVIVAEEEEDEAGKLEKARRWIRFDLSW